MNLQPEVGKVYYVLLPGEEECNARKVAQLTEHTVVLGDQDRDAHVEHTHDWFFARSHDKRYPRSSIRFVEEVKP
jgi:hypothetical protein